MNPQVLAIIISIATLAILMKLPRTAPKELWVGLAVIFGTAFFFLVIMTLDAVQRGQHEGSAHPKSCRP